MLKKDIFFYFSFPASTAKPKNSKRLSALDKFILEQYEKGHFDQIDSWSIEYDAVFNTVTREIGYDTDGNAIYKAPTRRAYGFWSDSNIPMSAYLKFGAQKIQPDVFNQDFLLSTED